MVVMINNALLLTSCPRFAMSFALNTNAYPHSLQFRLQNGHKPSLGVSADRRKAFKTQNRDKTISVHLQKEKNPGQNRCDDRASCC